MASSNATTSASEPLSRPPRPHRAPLTTDEAVTGHVWVRGAHILECIEQLQRTPFRTGSKLGIRHGLGRLHTGEGFQEEPSASS